MPGECTGGLGEGTQIQAGKNAETLEDRAGETMTECQPCRQEPDPGGRSARPMGEHTCYAEHRKSIPSGAAEETVLGRHMSAEDL